MFGVIAAPGCVVDPEIDDPIELAADEEIATDEEAVGVGLALFAGGSTVSASAAGAVAFAGILTLSGRRYWVKSNAEAYPGDYAPGKVYVKGATQAKTVCPESHFYAPRGLDIVKDCENKPGYCQGTHHWPCQAHHYNGEWIRYIQVGTKCKAIKKAATKCAGPTHVAYCAGNVGRCGTPGPYAAGIWDKNGNSLP